MAKKPMREDTHAWILAAHLYVIVIGAFVIAIGSDIYHAVQTYGGSYGS